MYVFTSISSDVAPMEFADMKAFRAAHAPLQLVVNGITVQDAEGNEYGKLRYIKKQRETMQEGRDHLADLLADIDHLELDDEQLQRDIDLQDNFSQDCPPPPVRGAAARAGLLPEDQLQGRQDAGWFEGPASMAPRSRAASSSSRMSHKGCGHAIAGEAGKIARAECRAARRAEAAA